MGCEESKPKCKHQYESYYEQDIRDMEVCLKTVFKRCRFCMRNRHIVAMPQHDIKISGKTNKPCTYQMQCYCGEKKAYRPFEAHKYKELSRETELCNTIIKEECEEC